MRTIKFRAWDKKNKIFWNHYLMDFEGNLHLIEKAPLTGLENGGGQMTGLTDEKDVELMQFTGLLDKNGKEIYDQDFLRSNSGQLWKIFWNDDICGYDIVDYPIESYEAEHIELRDCYGLHKRRLDHFEVVGNAYQNPELLIKPTV